MAISDGQEEDISIISFTFGTLSLICSIITLILIYYSKKWTGYLLLLLSLTLSQILYDINYMMRLSRARNFCYISLFMDVWGGLGISFWTNILSFSVAYTVINSTPIKIFQHYLLFSLYGTVIPMLAATLVVAVPGVISDDDNNGNNCRYNSTAQGNFFFDFYYWSRVAAIFLTIFFCTVTFVRLRTLRRNILNGTATNGSSLPRGSGQPRQQMQDASLVFLTVTRMNYYAIAQVVCRMGAAWNEWSYGRYSTYSSSVAAAVCSPSTGICSLTIFLIMQPNAYQNFKRLIFCRGLSRNEDHPNPIHTASGSSKPPSVAFSSGSSITGPGLSRDSEAAAARDSQDSSRTSRTTISVFNAILFNADFPEDIVDDDDI